MNFSDSVETLLTRLEKIDKIKDINEIFWNETKKQLNEGVGTLKGTCNELKEQLEGIDQAYYDRINNVFEYLDNAIRRVIKKYDDRYRS